MGTMREKIASLQFIFQPMTWIRNCPTSKIWDRKLNELMDKNKFIRVTDCTAKIGDVIVWVQNHPYASFTPYNLALEVMPSRLTVKRAYAKLLEDLL